MDEFTRGLLVGFVVCILAFLVWWLSREFAFQWELDYMTARARAERGEP